MIDEPNKRILIADGDEALVAHVAACCKRLGMRVTTAHNAKECLRAILREPPDLICVDLTMQAGDGLTVIQVVARDDEFSKIPMIILVDKPKTRDTSVDKSMCVYFLTRTGNVWERLEPVIHELVDLQATACD